MALPAGAADRLREYLHGDYLILYTLASSGNVVHLLSVRHQLRLPIAAISEQHRFGELSRMARSMIAQQADALRKGQATFDALLARAFQGA